MAKKLTESAAEEHSAKVAANIILQGEEARLPKFIYQLELTSHHKDFISTRTIECRGSVHVSPSFFLFKKYESGNEVIIPVGNVVALECIEMPTGKSKILGLDGVTPADAPKGIVS